MPTTMSLLVFTAECFSPLLLLPRELSTFSAGARTGLHAVAAAYPRRGRITALAFYHCENVHTIQNKYKISNNTTTMIQ
jgi:hypothetical protein